MGLTPLVFSLDAHPDEVTTDCRGQGLVLWFPIWSRLALGVWRLWQTHGEQPCRLESDSRPQCARVRVRFHTCSLEEGGRGAGEEAYLHSLQVFGFLKEKSRHFTGHVINQGNPSPPHPPLPAPTALWYWRNTNSPKQERVDSILWGWECLPGLLERFPCLISSACYHLTARLGGGMVFVRYFKNLFWEIQSP